MRREIRFFNLFIKIKMLERLIQDYQVAMKMKQENRKIILNYVIAQIKNKKIDLQRDLTDDEVIAVLRKEVKALSEAISFLERANHSSELESEREKKLILDSYLPQLMGKDQTRSVIVALIEREGFVDLKKERGQLMKLLMNEYKGQLDPAIVNEVISELI